MSKNQLKFRRKYSIIPDIISFVYAIAAAGAQLTGQA